MKNIKILTYSNFRRFTPLVSDKFEKHQLPTELNCADNKYRFIQNRLFRSSQQGNEIGEGSAERG